MQQIKTSFIAGLSVLCLLCLTCSAGSETAASESDASQILQDLRAAIARNPADLDAQSHLIRALLHENQLRDALDAAGKADQQIPNNAAIKALVGDVLYRLANFDKAYSFYLAGIGCDAGCSRCFLGAGKVQQTAFRRKSARNAFRKAYELNPEDPDIIIAYATTQANDEDKALLLEKFLRTAVDDPTKHLNSSRSSLDLHRKTAAKTTELLSPLQPYSVKLNIMRHRSQTSDGMYIYASLNHTKPIKLQLDTGASGLLIKTRAANAAGLTPLSVSQALGIGDDGARATQISLADHFKVGDLEIANLPVEFGEQAVPGDADGLIGTDVFSRFLIHLNIREQVMGLTPLPPYPDGDNDWQSHDRVVPDNSPSSVLARRIGHQLLVPTLVNDQSISYFLVDTGSSMNLIDEAYARRFTSVGITEMVKLEGISGGVKKLYSATHIRLQFGHFVQEDNGMLALKLDDLNGVNGVQVNGIIGWPTLSNLILSLNYRDGIVDFIHPSEAKKHK